jgi:hypothetical protein
MLFFNADTQTITMERVGSHCTVKRINGFVFCFVFLFIAVVVVVYSDINKSTDPVVTHIREQVNKLCASEFIEIKPRKFRCFLIYKFLISCLLTVESLKRHASPAQHTQKQDKTNTKIGEHHYHMDDNASAAKRVRLTTEQQQQQKKQSLLSASSSSSNSSTSGSESEATDSDSDDDNEFVDVDEQGLFVCVLY